MSSGLWKSHLLYQAKQSRYRYDASVVESSQYACYGLVLVVFLVVLVVLVVHSNDNIEDRLHVCSPKGLYTVLQGYVGMNQGDSERAE